MSADRRATHIYSKDAPAGFDPQFADAAAWRARADRLRTQTAVSLGLWPMPERGTVSPVVTARIERDAYTVENVYFASLPGHYVTGNVYRPRTVTGRAPAVLCPYGHWPDGRLIWRSDADCEKELLAGTERTHSGARSPMQAACATLARMGCVVFQYDMIGYGDSQQIAHTEGFTDVAAVLRLQSTLGLQAWNSLRSLDFLAADPSVDPSRIAITGASGGATQAIALAALDERVCASFLVVMVSMNMQGGCVCENAPLFRVDTNNVELALLSAPRPVGLVAADDWTRDFESRGLPEMRTVYELLGASDNVEGRHLSYKHNFNVHSRERLYDFMNRRLGLGWEGGTVEREFDPIPPAELRVFNSAHPLPADAADARGVRRWMSESSDAAMATLRARPAEFTAMLRAAWRAMIVDDLPSTADVVVTAIEHSTTGGCRQTRGTFSRRGAHEAVPYRVLDGLSKESAPTLLVLTDEGTAVADRDTDVVREAIAAGYRVVTIGLFGTPEHPAAALPATNYAGYTLGYNRSLVAMRARDILSAMAAFNTPRGMNVVARGAASISALVAMAVAPEAWGRAAVDVGGFDFDQITQADHSLMLAGAVKYGGVATMVESIARNAIVRGVAGSTLQRLGGVQCEGISVAGASVRDLVRSVTSDRV